MACLCISWPLGGIFISIVSYISLKTLNWRFILFITYFPIVIPIIVVCFFPSSPHFLLTTAEKEDARNVLGKIMTINNVEKFDYDLIEPENKPRKPLRELFNRQFASTIMYLSMMYFSQGFLQFGHVLLVVLLPLHSHTCISISDFNTFLTNALVDNSCCSMPSAATFETIFITSIGEIASVLITYPLIDRLGRRKTMMVSSILTCISFLLFIFCAGKILTNIFFVISRITISAFSITLTIYTFEVYPTSVRNLGVGFCKIALISGSITTTFITQILVTKGYGLSVVIINSGIMVVVSIVSNLLPYETAAKALKSFTDEAYDQMTEPRPVKLLQTTTREAGKTKLYGTY